MTIKQLTQIKTTENPTSDASYFQRQFNRPPKIATV